METKKSKRADLEGKRVIFGEVGLIVALSIVLISFQWKTPDRELKDLGTYIHRLEIEEIVPITQQQDILPPPPVKQVSVIRIVTDNQEVDEHVQIDAGATEETAIEEYIPPDDNFKVEEEVVEEEHIFMVVESAPGFPGGPLALKQFITEHLAYPVLAREANIQGTVYLSFIVGKTGEISDVRVLRGIGGGCDEEAVRVVQMMPRWEPGRQRGMPVHVRFNLPVKFTLY
jgi:protein TonB